MKEYRLPSQVEERMMEDPFFEDIFDTICRDDPDDEDEFEETEAAPKMGREYRVSRAPACDEEGQWVCPESIPDTAVGTYPPMPDRKKYAAFRKARVEQFQGDLGRYLDCVQPMLYREILGDIAEEIRSSPAQYTRTYTCTFQKLSEPLDLETQWRDWIQDFTGEELTPYREERFWDRVEIMMTGAFWSAAQMVAEAYYERYLGDTIPGMSSRGHRKDDQDGNWFRINFLDLAFDLGAESVIEDRYTRFPMCQVSMKLREIVALADQYEREAPERPSFRFLDDWGVGDGI